MLSQGIPAVPAAPQRTALLNMHPATLTSTVGAIRTKWDVFDRADIVRLGERYLR